MMKTIKIMPEQYGNYQYLGMFDLTKGLLMLIIILMHSFTDYFHYWEYDFSQVSFTVEILLLPLNILKYGIVPMFFMICGYGFRRRKMGTYIKTQLSYTLKPYIYVASVVFICTVMKKILIHENIIEGIIYQVLPYILAFCPGERNFLGIFMDSIGPVWFFVVFVMAGILLNAIIKEKAFWIQCILITMLGIVGVELRMITLPFCIQQTMICCGYLFVGMLIKKYKFPEKEIPYYVVIVAIIFCLVFGIFGNVEVSQNVWERGVADLIVSYIAGIILFVLFQRGNFLQGRYIEKIRWIGRHALWICCLHTVTYTVIPWEKIVVVFKNNPIVGFSIEFLFQLMFAIIGCKLLEAYNKQKRMRKKGV